jgi:hypothetical protein
MLGFLTFLSLAAIGAGTGGAFLQVLSPELGALVAGGGLLLLGVTFILAFLAGFVGGGRSTSWFALLFGFPAVLAAVGYGVQRFRVPFSDVSTNLVTPPKFVNPAYPFSVEKGAEYLDASLQLHREYDPAVAAAQIRLLPDLAGTKVKAPGSDTYARILKMVQEQLPAWKRVYDDPKKFHAEFVVEQPPFRLLNDVAIEVSYDQRMPNDSLVETRCRSRYPLVDLGVCLMTVQDLQLRLGIEMRALEGDIQHKLAMTPPPELAGTNTGTGTATVTTTATSTGTATGTATASGAGNSAAAPKSATPAPAPAKPAKSTAPVKQEKKK